MNQIEDKFLKQILEYAKIRGWRSAHFRPGMMANGRWITAGLGQTKGFPDIILVRSDRLIFAEVKTDAGEMSDTQLDWMESLSQTRLCECYLWTPSRWQRIQEILE